ncbi:DUF2793 domain-containing protein [Phyllobacterium leguminum]|uniref:Uncharacterized protein DUF2793 n=1 Tax=Phyllobacterium leguminum TaxID=314237 RepID=A0A318STN6_9HYPH|nr:DUF2793 domain-containing protein [Phyllobacterium leguminum]PYE85321.1 uncharacterized protein DUF2793 [Phyllobacterium leguminum]
MENTPNLNLPYILPSQAQKHVTHNEALQLLDAFVQLSVLDRDLTTPPAIPAEGSRYIVASGASGAWAGQDGLVACLLDGAWEFYAPAEGWIAWVSDEDKLLAWNGTAWGAVSGGGDGITLAELANGTVKRMGVNTLSDDANHLAVKTDAVLFSHDDVTPGTGDMRATINKKEPAKDAGLVFQTAWSTRALLGLYGSDNFALKVSPNGTLFYDALRVDAATGRIELPATNMLTDFAINLYQDSGRFAGEGAVDIVIGAFSFPRYLVLYNGSTVRGVGKFITDNSDYSGAGAALAPEVRSLIDMIRDAGAAGYRRWGLEFWVAEITAGGGTAASLTHNGAAYYTSCFTRQQVRAPAHTFHAYLRAVDSAVLVPVHSGARVFKNGVEFRSPNPVLVAPSEGWVSITIQDTTNPRSSYGYEPMIFRVYARQAGHRWQIACPALMGGLTKVSDDIGIIAGANSWAA